MVERQADVEIDEEVEVEGLKPAFEASGCVSINGRVCVVKP